MFRLYLTLVDLTCVQVDNVSMSAIIDKMKSNVRRVCRQPVAGDRSGLPANVK